MTTEDNPHDETKGTSQVFLVPIPNPDKDKDTNKEGFLNRPRKGGSSIWDWLTLLGVLAVPLVLGIATILLSTQQAHLADLQHESDQKLAQLQHDADQKQALDQQRATILQTYIDNIQDLLLNHNLLGSKSTDDVAVLARARTLTAIQGLDVSRKGVLVKFLYEARLIGLLDSKNKPLPPIINLSGTSLNRTDLDGIDLSNTSLDGVNLYYSTRNGADLNNALQPHFLITAIERKLFSLSSTCCEHIAEMSRIFIGKVYMGPNQIFPMVCRNRAWSGHRT
jgi:pentapeptide repeat protein